MIDQDISLSTIARWQEYLTMHGLGRLQLDKSKKPGGGFKSLMDRYV